MAFDQTTRNRLARFVSDARALLTEEFTRQLQNEYGLDPVRGDVTPIDRLTALDDRRRETAKILRETLEYYLASLTPTLSQRERGDIRVTLDRIVREQAFTVLNRLCALRMSEARGLVLESVAKGYQSKGFQLYARLAGSALGETGEAYRMYLFSLMDEFAVDLPVLFDRFSPQGRLFPREAVLLKLLELINDPEIDALWAEDETIGWIYQYFNSKEERKAMREASQAPRNSRELAVRNQFFTPRYVVEFLTDNTLGRIWYEMTKGETVLKDSCRYLVRRKHSFFLEEGQKAPEPFLPEQRHETDPDLAHEMWLPPNDQITDLNTIFLYGLTAGGYDYARKQWGIECGDLANEKLKQYHETGKWEGTFDELRCCLFFEQRRYRHFGEGPKGDDAKAILDLYQAICERWNLEVEYIPHRPLKDPREIKMLDPACGSMHFGLYAFDLFEQIYAEAWELEDRLGADALQRLADLEPLHKTYPDKETYLKDVPRLIIERNIHGVDIDPRAVQIAGLSLWLRAQKSWQAQGLRPGERPQIRKSNVVCAEPMPGDRAMLEEFLETLRGEKLEALMRKAWRVPADQKVRATPQMADALAKLVRTVWQEMELAGEAGSLLKIEETLRGAIAAARKESEEKSPLFRVLEYGLGEPPQEKYVQVVAGEDQDFFARSEVLVLAALKDYAEQAVNGESYQRRLFAGDAIQGFAFIDICRNQYDAVVMNPPFGACSVISKKYIEEKYPETKADLAYVFIQRLIKLSQNGLIGIISTRTGFFLSTLSDFRIKVLNNLQLMVNFADLGYGILDAVVETAAYTISPSKKNCTISAYDILEELNKEDALTKCIRETDQKNQYIVNSSLLHIFPGLPFSYWAPQEFIENLKKCLAFEPNFGFVKRGVATGDNWRFIRLSWETPLGCSSEWLWYARGGEYSPYYISTNFKINWKNNGNELSNYYDEKGKLRSRPQNIDHFRRLGLAYASRTTSGFGPRILLENHGFDQSSNPIFLNEKGDLLPTLGVLMSRPVHAFIYLAIGGGDTSQSGTAAHDYTNGLIGKIPIPPLSEDDKARIADNTAEIISILRKFSFDDETSPDFDCVSYFHIIKNGFIKSADEIFHDRIEKKLRVLELSFEIDKIVINAYGLGKRSIQFLDSFIGCHPNDYQLHPSLDIQQKAPMRQLTKKCYWSDESIEQWSHERRAHPKQYIFDKALLNTKILSFKQDLAYSIISFMFGVCIGRWNSRYNSEEKQYFPKAPLDPYPVNSICLAIRNIGDQLMSSLNHQPILVDDASNERDIERVLRHSIELITDQSEQIEQELASVINYSSIKQYLVDANGFFKNHLQKFSYRDRSAPIYWPLSTPSGSYTLWLYYHRLNDQTLYTCVNDFVDPKLKQVSEEAARLRLKKGRSAADEKELERLTDFERELRDFREELLRVAKFWKPNLNDGVEITAAPLWKLFQHKPWQKRLKETWQKLEAGEYDWAHLAYSIWPERVREKCKTDKSLAIAHDLEELYVEPEKPLKKGKPKKRAADEETEGWFDED